LELALGLPVCLAVSLLSGPAHARSEEMSMDIELVRPAFGAQGLPAIDAPAIDAPGTVRVGVLVQRTSDPLLLRTDREELGVVIGQRYTSHLGLSIDATQILTWRLQVPAIAQGGGEIPELAADGLGLGDLGLGAVLRFVQTRRLNLGFSGDLLVPTGTTEAWMGEALPRARAAALSDLALGRVDLLGELGVMLRNPVATDYALALDDELVGGSAVRLRSRTDRAALSLGMVARNPLAAPLTRSEESASEVLSGVELRIGDAWRLDLGAGKGLARGYGTSQWRWLMGLTWIHHRPDPEPEPVISVALVPEERPPPTPIDEPDEPAPPPVEEAPLAVVEAAAIVIRDPVQFEFGTARILPVSLPMLRYVGQLLNDDPTIGHLVIEGHASEEGSLGYNYDLSIRRARSVWEELVVVGVHPNRISYRGMGEVVPKAGGDDEESLASNRRVEFRIVVRHHPLDPIAPLPPAPPLPWSGEAGVVQVRSPEAEPAETRFVETVTAESRSGEAEPVETGAAGSIQTGSIQTGSIQTGSIQTGSIQTGAVESPPGEPIQTGAEEAGTRDPEEGDEPPEDVDGTPVEGEP